MRTTANVCYFAEGHLRLRFYENPDKTSVAVEIYDDTNELGCPAFFVNKKYQARLKAAIEAFNKTWSETNGTAE